MLSREWPLTESTAAVEMAASGVESCDIDDVLPHPRIRQGSGASACMSKAETPKDAEGLSLARFHAPDCGNRGAGGMVQANQNCVVIAFPAGENGPAPAGETKPYSVDVISSEGGMSLIDACIPDAVLASLMLLLRHGAYVEADSDGVLIVRRPR